MKRWAIQLAGLANVLIVLAACATTGQQYPVTLSYQTNASAAQKTSFLQKVVVFPLEDLRKDPSLIGKRTHLFGQVDTFETKVPVGQRVAEILVDSLKQKGFDAKVAGPGERPGESGASRIVTGKVETLWAEAGSHIGYTQIDARLRLFVEILDRNTGGITTFNISDTDAPKVFIFHFELIQENLNDMISNGLRRIKLNGNNVHAS